MPQHGELIAVNIVALPGAELEKRAIRANAFLRHQKMAVNEAGENVEVHDKDSGGSVGDGFRFGKTFIPHLTLVQAVVRRADLDKLATAVASAVADAGIVAGGGVDMAVLKIEPGKAGCKPFSCLCFVHALSRTRSHTH
jgi:hypothetical protein